MMSVVFGAQDPGDVFVLYSSVYVCVHTQTACWELLSRSTWKDTKGGRYRGVGEENRGQSTAKKQKMIGERKGNNGK